jgi:hypothetical protein
VQLPAAGLRRGQVDLDALVLQHLDGRPADLGNRMSLKQVMNSPMRTPQAPQPAWAPPTRSATIRVS